MEENQQNETPSLEAGAFEIIALAGQAKSDTLIALKKVKGDAYEEARALLKEANDLIVQASGVHLKLLSRLSENSEENLPFLVIHAEDHYSQASYSYELVSELLDIFEKKLSS
ncbi:PTS lactose/cellobiose transporter subunit IIA [Oceanobacillus neutriphilus]|uniref:PTS lactose transporter subunit IIA n=1 Tax=Oceanobacillus neutriphilus TaxID=531815 RepID=A0ABQ2NT55_9BACI|nr:PTS lactose/cellobiose transporter subunit IIA [Oceanobacillus neutriphilus]GGP09971.1 PTS lactose transporter subunit IIA [Oceanobacillus neutriphilus]